MTNNLFTKDSQPIIKHHATDSIMNMFITNENNLEGQTQTEEFDKAINHHLPDDSSSPYDPSQGGGFI